MVSTTFRGGQCAEVRSTELSPHRRRYRVTSMAPTCLLLLLLTALASVCGDMRTEAIKRGKDAEARQQWDKAYEEYDHACSLNPSDLECRAALTRLRFAAATAHVHTGHMLREAGRVSEAEAEFQRALQIDPSIDVQLLNPRPKEPRPRAQQLEGPVTLQPIPNTPVNLRMTEDTKAIYFTLGKLAGINVVFDPDYTSRRITVDLLGVSLREALETVALQSKTFFRPVTRNTIFVTSDTAAKRKELEQSVVKTFYLGNVSRPTDLQEAVNMIRQVLEMSRVQQVSSQNAIIMRGTPDQVVLAEKLLSDVDKAPAEVVLEVAIMQVSRSHRRTTGIQPPTSASVQLQPNVSSKDDTINLNRFGSLDATDFQVKIPAASLALLRNDSNTKIIQNPQMRALDNQKATLKIGDRVPVATGSFQPGVGGTGTNPLVNTQFQYLDVGVNIDVTPRLMSGREVSLKLVLEVSSVTGSTNIGGIQQPTIGQRKIEHEITLKDGEVSLLGGILEEQEATSLNGFPWISKVPILRYLFAQDDKSRQENEIVFALIPHIVRSRDATELNLRAVDVGTANAIHLRDDTTTPEATIPSLPTRSKGAATGTEPGPQTPK